MKPDVLNDATL